jgi:hypothetical protein
MHTLAEIVVNNVAFLMLDQDVAPDAAVRQLEEIGLLLLQSSDEEKQAVLEICRAFANTLPAHADPEVRAFFRNFGAEFGLDSN